MSLFGGGSPSAPPPPPPPPNPATIADSGVQQAAAQTGTRLAAAAGAGFGDTITNVGGAQGLQAPATAQTKLLGG